MKVFVAGASGAIGRPLIAALAAARHEVIGMTSKEAGIKALREKGAEGVVVNALDADAVRVAIARVWRRKEIRLHTTRRPASPAA
jgi:nucleoside-diphosphate-sugar epimerase